MPVSAARKPELLAPAGTIAAGLTAFDHGADAVYAGLPRFNARERSDNCTAEEMSKLIAYAHRNGRRVYVTVNTLIKESELAAVAEMLAALADMGPDAVIVQDLGVLRLLRRCFPALSVHASTQMGIHNSAGAAFAQGLGVERVILERQVTLEELAAIRASTTVELEVFVHGALCCGRSGECLFSSWLGGWSGNRGKCKQPCRRRYFSEKGNGFFFSTGDLCALESVPRLKELGIAGLKIEGRLRREDYVRAVVSAYRLMLDAPAGSERDALGEARRVLAETPSRRWTSGFSSTGAFAQVLQHRALGATGTLCGRVVRAEPGAFTARLSRGLQLYDRVRVQPETGDEGPVFTVTRLLLDGHPVTRAARDQVVTIPCDKPVDRQAVVFKVGVSVPDMRERIAKLPIARAALDLRVRVAAAGVEVEAGSRHWSVALPIAEALKQPLEAATVADEFRKSRSESLQAGRIGVEIDGRLFLPAPELKKLRRAFWEWAEGELDPAAFQPGRAGLDRFAAEYAAAAPGPAAGSAVEAVVRPPAGSASPVAGATVVRAIDESGAADEWILPEFCPEGELGGLRERIRRRIESGARRFRVTSLYGLELLRPHAGLRVTASFPVPACNSLAVRQLLDGGAARVQAWVELDRAGLEALAARSGAALEVYAFGRLALLTTRAVTEVTGRVGDGRGLFFDVVREGGLTRLYPDKPFALPEPPPGVASAYRDCSRARLGEPATADFNYSHEFV